MRLRFQNIGIIEEADININGITLIAGQNDSGKSTVGKVLYALIRGLNIDEDRFNSSKKEFVRSKIMDIRNLLLRAKTSNDQDNKIRKTLFENYLENDNSLFYILSNGFDIEDEVVSKSFLNDIEEIKNLYDKFENQTVKLQLDTFYNDILERIKLSINSNEVLHYELKSFLDSEFNGQIQNKFSDNKCFVKIDNDKEILIDKKPFDYNGFNSNYSFYYNDVIFIESPLRLNDRRFIFTDTMIRDKNIYLNYKIFKPNKEKDVFSDNTIETLRLNKLIFDIINGGFEINSKNEIIYKKGGVDFDFGNIASGIKTFGVLQLLLQKDQLNSNTLLIIDEPEVHLHPTWQVKFAEILVILSKEFAIPIVLTSHSPYFIEALEAYTKKYKYEDSTNFYFAEKNENGLTSKIVNVTDNTVPILNSISEAFHSIQDINEEIYED
jgi:predicted ATP-dependent endonuclease of OLD family